MSATVARPVEAEIARLARRYGRPRNLVHTLPKIDFGPINRGRSAEVAMAIRRPTGHFLLQTKQSYPKDTFRLPTGGIKRGEAIEHALLRETVEETSLEVEISRFVATITYRSPQGNRVFSSFLFILEERGGVLRPNDPTEGITGWREADRTGLDTAARALRTCTGSWAGWGRFRALVIDALVPALDMSGAKPQRTD